MKNKNLIIGIIVICLVLFVGGGYFVLSSKKTSTIPAPSVVPQPPEETVDTLLPEDIGLSLTATPDNKKVIIQVTNIEDISSLDYELSYTAKGDIPRGVIGQIDIKAKKSPVKQEIVLGTCSDVCHYDKEVSDIKLVVKVTKLDNKIYSVEKTLDI